MTHIRDQKPDIAIPQSLDLKMERKIAAAHGDALIGVDEAGRGPWAGPVATAAVILDYDNLPPGLNDSKKLSEAKREALFPLICASAQVAIVFASPSRIDAMNIRGATLWAMAQAVSALDLTTPRQREQAGCLIDGRDTPDGIPYPARPVIKGDARILAISAASICAKVARDRAMVRLDQCYPAYGFRRHKGYGTAEHATALKEHGPCPLHRRSFRPIQLLSPPKA